MSEFKETLSNVKSQSPLTTTQNSKEYNYTSGASYMGQWCGGFRHGHGFMKWPDGATYEGQWSWNHACGKGKFRHTSGDIYEG